MTSLVGKMTDNKALLTWVEEMAGLCAPDRVHWCDGSQEESDTLCRQMVETGTMIRLNEKKRANDSVVRPLLTSSPSRQTEKVDSR